MKIKSGNGVNYPWKEKTYYKVHVELFHGNIKHEAIFHSGFLHKGQPCGYACIWSATYEGEWVKDVHFMDVQQELFTDQGFVK